MTTFNGDHPDRAHHIGDDYAQHPMRRAFNRIPQLIRQRPQRIGRSHLIQPHRAAQQTVFGQAPQNKIGVRYGRLGSPHAITRGSGVRPGAGRAHLQQPVAVEPGDGPATGPHRVDIDHRQTDREFRNALVEINARLTIAD